MKSPIQEPTSVHHFPLTGRRLRGDQVALGVDPPATGESGELGVERPAVWLLLPFVCRVGALQRHATGVVADGPDLLDLWRAEQQPGRNGGELGPLLLDRPRF